MEKMWFLFKILHVMGRNTCLCKEEMCFILLERVLTSFFLYTGLVTIFTYIVFIFEIYIYIYIYKYMMYVFFTYFYMCCFFYFCFTLRCYDEFCLKCFKNIGCQNLLAINSLLAKFSRICVRIDFIVFNKWV